MAKKKPVSDLEDHLGYWLRLVSNHVSHAFKLKVEARGVTVAEWVVLRSLFTGEERNPSQIATKLGMTRGAISKLVDRLVDKQLVSIRAEKQDRRYQTIRLSAAGNQLVPHLAALADANDFEYFGHFTGKQRAQLVRLLQAIVARGELRGSPIN
jgi:DNA-binding MarR family transcriptional regulator